MELFPFQSTFQFEVLNTRHEEAVLTIVFRCVITYPICIIYLTIKQLSTLLKALGFTAFFLLQLK